MRRDLRSVAEERDDLDRLLTEARDRNTRIAAAIRAEANATTDDSCRDADDERLQAVLARLLAVVEGG